MGAREGKRQVEMQVINRKDLFNTDYGSDTIFDFSQGNTES